MTTIPAERVRADLAEKAAAVLRHNDAGGWTKAAPALYPHQWSWDSAFVAIGWAQVDLARAAAEQERLFSAQWANGMVPHIVFDPATPAGAYFPDHTRWASWLSPHAPQTAPFTSGLCQPPVHAIAVERIWEVACGRGGADAELARAHVRRMFPKLLAWHRYLAEQRDPDGTGLVTTYHPWEGIDNSPRWDVVMRRIEVGQLPPYTRRDTQHVADSGQRPSQDDYDRYLWLVELLKAARYDDAVIRRDYPFLVGDVFLTAVLAAANAALLRIADVAGAPAAERDEIERWLGRGRAALAATLDPETGLTLDVDRATGEPIRVTTFAGVAPLVDPGADPALRAAALRAFDSADLTGHPALRWPLLPSTGLNAPQFQQRNYWRGPVWPVVNWLYWHGLCPVEPQRAAALRAAALDALAVVRFAEYFDPITGEPLGSHLQSWTAAVALDWLAPDR
ncbi:MAG TPA: glycogen debranching protein [Pseudonocardia sp.]|nr:glycogen debranching protein [Pseudonocardia sp.]